MERSGLCFSFQKTGGKLGLAGGRHLAGFPLTEHTSFLAKFRPMPKLEARLNEVDFRSSHPWLCRPFATGLPKPCSLALRDGPTK